MIRPRCRVQGCKGMGENKGHLNGRIIYRHVCARHRNRHQSTIDNNHCIACGWEGDCDRHRIKAGRDGGKYHRLNVLVLCPNCHRAAHGRGDWNKPGVSIESLIARLRETESPLLAAAS